MCSQNLNYQKIHAIILLMNHIKSPSQKKWFCPCISSMAQIIIRFVVMYSAQTNILQTISLMYSNENEREWSKANMANKLSTNPSAENRTASMTLRQRIYLINMPQSVIRLNQWNLYYIYKIDCPSVYHEMLKLSFNAVVDIDWISMIFIGVEWRSIVLGIQ